VRRYRRLILPADASATEENAEGRVSDCGEGDFEQTMVDKLSNPDKIGKSGAEGR
jgi:hypothetical protein